MAALDSMSSIPAPKPRLPRWVLPAAILLATFLAYVGTLQFQFVYDDAGQIVVNTFIKQWKYLPVFFQTHVWAQFNLHAISNYYRPFFLIWLLLNFKAFGLNPVGWHLTTVLAHMLATLAVFYFAQRLTRDRVAAGIAALLFGLLPVHLEAVAWVSGVTEPLFAMLLIPAFLCYLNFREGKGGKWIGASLLLYAVAQFSKETAVVLPVFIGAYELLFPLAGETAPRSWAQRIRRGVLLALPYAVITAVYIPARIHALTTFSITNYPVPWTVNLMTIPGLLVFYLRLLFWPVGLSAFYDTDYVTAPGFQSFILPLLIVLGVAAALVWIGLRSRSRTYWYLLLWTILPLLPVLNLKYFVKGELAHDRYLYLPSVGACILLGMALRRIPWGRVSLAGSEPVPAIPIAALALVMMATTILQSTYWANDLLLYKRGVDTAPGNNLARTDLGNALIDAGRYEEGMEMYREVLARDPNFWLCVYNMGYENYAHGNYERAENYLVHAAELYPVDGDTFYWLAQTEMNLGRLDRAEQAMDRALANEPRALGYRYVMGVVLQKQGKLVPAIEMFRGELAKNPADAKARQALEETEAQLKSISSPQSVTSR